MPQYIATAIITATGATGTAAALITVGTYVATTALTVYAASEAAKAAAEDAMRAAEADMGTQTSMSFRTDAPRRLIYGTTKASGPVAYVGTSGTDNKYLHMIVLLGEGPVHAIDDVFLGDTNLDLVSSGTGGDGITRFVPNTGNKYAGLVRVKKHLGGTNQDADSDASGEISEWTANHRLRGIAYLYVRLQYDQDKLTSIPNVSAIVRGKKVYDPRDGNTKFSNNPALCIRDYLLNENGLDADSSEVDDTRISEQANVCDQTVDGQARYTMDGMLSLAISPIQAMEQMLACCVGTLPYVQGKHQLQVAYDIPASRNHAVDESFLRGPVQIQTDGGKSKRINSVRGTFMDPANSYNVVDFSPYTDSTYISEDGQKLWADVTFNFVKDNKRAQRIAKLLVERNRQNMTIALQCNLKAFNIAVNDTITFSLDRDGAGGESAIFTNKKFRVTGWTLNADGGVDLEGVEEDNTIYDWNNGQSFGIDVAPNTSLPQPNYVAPPTAVSAPVETPNLNADGSLITEATVSWTAASDAFVGSYEVELQIYLGSSWVTQFTQIVEGTRTSAKFTGLVVTKAYRAKVRSISILQRRSAPATGNSTTMAGDSTAPAVTTATGVAGHRRAQLTWTNPSDVDFAGVEFVRKTATGKPATNTVPTFTLTGVRGLVQQAIDENLANGTSYRYWIRTVDFTGNKSDWRPNNNTGLVITPAAEALGSFDNSGSGFITSSDIPVTDVTLNGTSVIASDSTSADITAITGVQINGTDITATNGVANVGAITGVQINGTDITATSGIANVGAITEVKINETAVTATSGSVDLQVLTGLTFNGTAVTASSGDVSISAITGVGFSNGGTATVDSNGGISLGNMAGIDGITTANASTFLADTIISNDMLAGSITAGKLDVANLAAITANAGTITAGTLQSSDGNFVIDLTNKSITITV